MFYNDTITDSFDEDMLPFTESESYKYQHAANTQMLQTFRSGLTPEQQKQFNKLMNSLSNEYSDLVQAAYECGYGKARKRTNEYER